MMNVEVEIQSAESYISTFDIRRFDIRHSKK